MKRTFYVCDHCGKELNEMVDFTETTLETTGEFFSDVDLCAECAADLSKMINDFLNRKEKKHD